MPDRKPPLKMPPPPLAPGQASVTLGARRYVLNAPQAGPCFCGNCPTCMRLVVAAADSGIDWPDEMRFGVKHHNGPRLMPPPEGRKT